MCRCGDTEALELQIQWWQGPCLQFPVTGKHGQEYHEANVDSRSTEFYSCHFHSTAQCRSSPGWVCLSGERRFEWTGDSAGAQLSVTMTPWKNLWLGAKKQHQLRTGSKSLAHNKQSHHQNVKRNSCLWLLGVWTEFERTQNRAWPKVGTLGMKFYFNELIAHCGFLSLTSKDTRGQPVARSWFRFSLYPCPEEVLWISSPCPASMSPASMTLTSMIPTSMFPASHLYCHMILPLCFTWIRTRWRTRAYTRALTPLLNVLNILVSTKVYFTRTFSFQS